MDVKIKSLSIVNFKGVTKAEWQFNETDNEFRGDNGTGKTTIADAFFWCLFEKDSKGRSDFDIKRIDKSGNTIMRETHTVTVVLMADDKEIKLSRTLVEDWARRRGDKEETFKGNHIDRYWNDVPVTKTEFDNSLHEELEIYDEDVIKYLVLPTYFLSQKREEQRSFLIKMAGEISDADILKEHPEFAETVKALETKSMTELEKFFASNIKTEKERIDTIPARIEENKLNMPEEEDWCSLSAQISHNEYKIHEIEKQIEDVCAAYNAQSERKQAMFSRLTDIKMQIQKREMEIKNEINSSFYVEQSQQNKLKMEYDNLKADTDNITRTISGQQTQIDDLQTKRNMMLHKYHECQQESFILNPDNMVCPTCGQKLPDNLVDDKIKQMNDEWNQGHARRMNDIINEGKRIKTSIESITAQMNSNTERINKNNMRMAEIESMPLFKKVLSSQDCADSIANDAVIKKLTDEENTLKTEIDSYSITAPDTDDLKSQKASITIDIEKLKIRLANKDRIIEIEKRNAELENVRNAALDTISALEGRQYLLSQYKKIRMNLVEERVNKLFKLVKFRMYEPQINGGEKETCIATVDGVPYGRSLNTAAEINAGIDVINTIAASRHLTMPIFVDNRETVTFLIPTSSQVINLTKDENYNSLTKTK